LTDAQNRNLIDYCQKMVKNIVKNSTC